MRLKESYSMMADKLEESQGLARKEVARAASEHNNTLRKYETVKLENETLSGKLRLAKLNYLMVFQYFSAIDQTLFYFTTWFYSVMQCLDFEILFALHKDYSSKVLMWKS